MASGFGSWKKSKSGKNVFVSASPTLGKKNNLFKRITDLNRQYGEDFEVANKLQALFEVHNQNHFAMMPSPKTPEYQQMKKIIDQLSTKPKASAKKAIIFLLEGDQKTQVQANVYPNGWATSKSSTGYYRIVHLRSGMVFNSLPDRKTATKAIGLLDSMKISGNFDGNDQKSLDRIRFASAILNELRRPGNEL